MKIGEIFECNGEWYQCVEQPKKYDKTVCALCAFQGNGNCELDRCSGTYRSDKKFVIFKKLEKVGEPYEHCGKLYQCYKLPMEIEIRLLPNNCNPIGKDNLVEIEIKQNKEDMVNKKTNFMEEIDALCKRYNMAEGVRADFMAEVKEIIKDENREYKLKPFDLEATKAGKPVCTRDGRKARIICFDRVTNSTNEYTGHLIVLVTNPNGDEQSFYYTEKGSLAGKDEYDNHKWDLMMLSEKKEGWVNVYKSQALYHFSAIYKSKEEALEKKSVDCIDTILVEWEE